MNFLEKSDERIRCVSVIKFTDNVRFALDGECIKKEILAEFGNKNSANIFEGEGIVTDLVTGSTTREKFTLVFKGFFREAIEGKIKLANEVHPKEYGRYTRLNPYLITFYYDSLKEKSCYD